MYKEALADPPSLGDPVLTDMMSDYEKARWGTIEGVCAMFNIAFVALLLIGMIVFSVWDPFDMPGWGQAEFLFVGGGLFVFVVYGFGMACQSPSLRAGFPAREAAFLPAATNVFLLRRQAGLHVRPGVFLQS
jgi:hypothetical protein